MQGNVNRIKIRKVSFWSSVIAALMAVTMAVLLFLTWQQFKSLRADTERYIACENASKDMQDGSDYLTERARLFVSTGKTEYLKQYFNEAKQVRRREKAVEILRSYFEGNVSYNNLEHAMERSDVLMQIEYRAMRLRLEADAVPEDTWEEELRSAVLTEEELELNHMGKLRKAQELMNNTAYQEIRDDITRSVTACMDNLIIQIRNIESHSSEVYMDMFVKLTVLVALLFLMVLINFAMVRRIVVLPLISFNESIRRGKIFPIIGADELQSLAETYNEVYEENQEAQRLIRHEAEYDALTETLNRRYFEKLLNIYGDGRSQYALILCDVDTFKSVNDNYGHAVGDVILKKVAAMLKSTFRNVDYVCRIGGDEFAVIMVEVTSDLDYTIRDKISYINTELKNPREEGVPPVSLSVGVAFADRPDPSDSIFKDADAALYYVKEHGRCGCEFYPKEEA